MFYMVKTVGNEVSVYPCYYRYYNVPHYTDINECLQGQACDQNADCDNTPGSFDCSCRSGYRGDGLSCAGRYSVLIYF
jgi:hypothetical protein